MLSRTTHSLPPFVSMHMNPKLSVDIEFTTLSLFVATVFFGHVNLPFSNVHAAPHGDKGAFLGVGAMHGMYECNSTISLCLFAEYILSCKL